MALEIAQPVFDARIGERRISPTDIAQFIRLGQCRRYLRLRLYERSGGRGFMARYGVAPQAIGPLFTRSGAEFEERVQARVRARFPDRVRDLAAEAGHAAERPHDNRVVVQAACDVRPGEPLFLFQRAWT